MSKTPAPRCAKCETKACRKGQDCFGIGEEHKAFYQDANIGLLQRATAACDLQKQSTDPRLKETIRFAQQLGCKKVGLAFCLALAAEARVIESLLAQHFQVVSVCCKTGGIGKADLNLPQTNPVGAEIMCNPAGQADLLNKAGTELNIICGLCVGHDAIFSKCSDAPVTTLIVKDRALKHNSAAAIYDEAVLERVKTELGHPTTSSQPVAG